MKKTENQTHIQWKSTHSRRGINLHSRVFVWVVRSLTGDDDGCTFVLDVCDHVVPVSGDSLVNLQHEELPRACHLQIARKT